MTTERGWLVASQRMIYGVNAPSDVFSEGKEWLLRYECQVSKKRITTYLHARVLLAWVMASKQSSTAECEGAERQGPGHRLWGLSSR